MRAPAGFYPAHPANELYKHVVMAGCVIVCLACRAEGRLPSPRDVHAYDRDVEAFILKHKACTDVHRGAA